MARPGTAPEIPSAISSSKYIPPQPSNTPTRSRVAARMALTFAPIIGSSSFKYRKLSVEARRADDGQLPVLEARRADDGREGQGHSSFKYRKLSVACTRRAAKSAPTVAPPGLKS